MSSTGDKNVSRDKNYESYEDTMMSKIEQAKKIFNEVTAKDFGLGGKSARAVFTEKVMAEIGMSKSGANTYFQNLKNERDLGERYKYSPSSKKSTTDQPAAVPEGSEDNAMMAMLTKMGNQLTTLSRTVRRMEKQQQAAH